MERQTRTVRLLHMPFRDSGTLHGALKARLADLPPPLLRSITWDQGTEMARHLRSPGRRASRSISATPHSPWQRGSNENMNGLLRDYFPKGTNLSAHPVQHLLAVENEINNRPPADTRRSCSSRPVRRAASLRKSASVATLTRTCPGAMASFSKRRRQRVIFTRLWQ